MSVGISQASDIAMENTSKRSRKRDEDGFSRQSTTELRASLQTLQADKARLVSERASLTYRANRVKNYSSELVRAFNSLDTEIRESLVLREPIQVYREFVESISERIASAERQVAATKPTPFFYIGFCLYWLLLTGWVAFCTALISAIADAFLEHDINVQHVELFTLAICVIAQSRISPKVLESIAGRLQPFKKAQAQLIEAQQRYNNRTAVAASIKKVSPYSDDLRQRRIDGDALSALASKISRCDASIEVIERLIARRNSTSRATIPEHIRSEVFRRDQEQCNKCGSKKDLHFDHIIPHSRGGADTLENLQLLCVKCNLTKGAKI